MGMYLCIRKNAVEFSQFTYNVTESSGNASITLLLRKKVVAIDINVVVIPSEQSPPSAIGKIYG